MLNIVFCGTPEFAATSLVYLLSCPCKIQAVVTMPDKKQGRGQIVKPNPVKRVALEQAIPVFQPEKATDPEFLKSLADLQPDLIAVVAYGKILRNQFITIPRYGCINLHSSYLPKYRGASPIQWALMNGDTQTGVTTFMIDEGMDTGNIILQKQVPIGDHDTFGILHDTLASEGARVLWETIQLFEQGIPELHKQPEEGVSYSQKITPELSIIDWNKPAQTIHNLIRAMNPVPGARSTMPIRGEYKSIKIFRTEIEKGCHTFPPGSVASVTKDSFAVVCADEALIVKELQIEGKALMATADFLRGHSLNPGVLLGK